MSIDIEKLKKKLAETQERMKGGGGSDFKFWAPKDGRNVVRILPPKPGEEDFYAEARVHYNVGPDKKMVTCGKTNRNTCAVCDMIDALYATKNSEDEKLAKRMRATSRYYFNVIDRSVEEDSEDFGEVYVFGSGAMIFTDVLGIMVDPDYGDITDRNNGYDLIITKSGKGLDTEYKTNARPKQTAIGVEGWEDKLIDLTIFTTPKSDEDLEAILDGREPESNSKPQTSSNNTVSQGSSSPAKENDDIETGGEVDDIEAEIAAMLQKHRK